MGITKQGIITSGSIIEPEGANILYNAGKYTALNPYVLTGTGSDIIATLDMYCEVTPGNTYYLTCRLDKEWSASHGYSESTKGKGTIWLYLSKTYNASNMGYDNPVCFTSSSYIKPGVWRYTIPSDYHMARIRLNTYSDGTNSVTCKFWDICIIPEKYYVFNNANGSLSNTKLGKDFTIANNFIEI